MGSALSFRTRLTLRWTVAFGLLMTIALVSVYAGARAYGYHALDLHLRTVAATELASSTDQGVPIHLHDFPESALNQSEFAPKFSQVYDRDGRLVLQTGALRSREPLLDAATIAAAFDGEAPLVDVRHEDGPARMVALRAVDDTRTTYVIAVGMRTRPVDDALTQLAWLLAGIWVVALGATGAIGYALASRALEPIDRITARATEIARDRIGARLDPPQQDDEIGRMTRLLNEMLDRLHAVIDANRHFAADASHELRSPLTAIAGEIDVALIRDRPPEEYRETLRLVRQQVNEMFTLADNLTLLVRAERGTSDESVREVPLNALLHDCCSRLQALAVERGVPLRLLDAEPASAQPGVPRAGVAQGVPSSSGVAQPFRAATSGPLDHLVVFGDARLLGRAVENVIANALQYSQPGGEVIVKASYAAPTEGAWEPGRVRVHVSDCGPGIPEPEWERVFDRFYRRDASRSRRTGGTGLGLTICRAILTLFGGQVRVLSSSPAGSTFELDMRGGEAGAASAPPVTPVASPALRTAQALLLAVTCAIAGCATLNETPFIRGTVVDVQQGLVAIQHKSGEVTQIRVPEDVAVSDGDEPGTMAGVRKGDRATIILRRDAAAPVAVEIRVSRSAGN